MRPTRHLIAGAVAATTAAALVWGSSAILGFTLIELLVVIADAG
jgi:hypothetical protein